MSKKFLIGLAVVVIIIGLIVFGSEMISARKAIEPSVIAISDLIVSENKVTMTADLLSSGLNFTDYQYELDGDVLVLTFYGELAKREPKGQIEVEIEENRSKFNKIMIATVEESKIIWEK